MRKAALLLTLISLQAIPFLSPLARAASVGVNAVVPASANDFSVLLSTIDTGASFGQSHTIPFTITYSNKLSYSTSITIKASWSKGTVQGDSFPSVEVLHYLSGSASNAYGNTAPIIDTLNRTISWEISSYPGNDTQGQVTFSLETSNSLASTIPISLEISSSLAGPGTNASGNTLTKYFKTEPETIAPTSTPGPTNTTSITTTPTQSPTTQQPESIENVSVSTIQSTDSQIRVTLSTPSSITLEYGTSPKSLSQSVSYTTRARSHIIALSSLKPKTKYYYKITSTDAFGEKTISDIYTFQTSSEDIASVPEIDSFVVSSSEVILSSTNEKASKEGAVQTVVLPPLSSFEFRFSLADSQNIKDVQAFLRDKKVLGINSIIDKAYAETEAIDLVETSPGVYLGRLRTPLNPGLFELYLRISDTKGNIIEKKVSEIKISSPFIVLSSDGREGIEGAEVTLYLWNAKNKAYEKMRLNGVSVRNPLFTNKEGHIDVVLPRGRYKAVVRTIHYKETTVEFSIGEKTNDGYPTIRLTQGSFDPISYLIYFGSALSDVFLPSTSNYLDQLTTSKRMLHLIILTILISLLLITFLSTSARMQIPLASLPSYLLYHLRSIFKRPAHASSFDGKVTDHSHDYSLAGVNVYLTHPETEQVIAHAVTGKNGTFHFPSFDPGSYRVSFLKSGYQALVITKSLPLSKSFPVALAAHPKPENIPERLLHFMRFIFSSSFEIILFGSMMLLLATALQTGWKDIYPLIIVSGANIVLWYLHRR